MLDARIGYIAAALAQVDGVRLWHDQLLYKPPAADVATGKSDFVAVLAEDRPEDGSITFHQGKPGFQCSFLHAVCPSRVYATACSLVYVVFIESEAAS